MILVTVLAILAFIGFALFMFPTVYRHFISHASANEAKHIKTIKPEEIIVEERNVNVTVGEIVVQQVASTTLAQVVLTHDEIRSTLLSNPDLITSTFFLNNLNNLNCSVPKAFQRMILSRSRRQVTRL